MNVGEQIINVINALCEKFGIAIDWTADNILPYIETLCGKFIKWEICTSIFYMVFWIVFAGIAWLISIPLIKKAKEDQWDFDYSVCSWIATIIIVVASMLTIGSIINLGVQSYDIIEAITFPEKTIYEYVTYYIQGNS
jgi:hypothetical protein